MQSQDDLFSDTPPRAPPEDAREVLTKRWFALTRERLPQMAARRDGAGKRDCADKWPVHLDHCFMRILLDNACSGMWRAHIKPPAYAHAPLELLERAVQLGEAVERGEADLHELNRRSLEWRGKR